MKKEISDIIVLRKGEATLTNREYMKFSKGDTIWGNDRETTELKRWRGDELEQAKEELAKYKCSYSSNGHCWFIEEYALECFSVDEDGEFWIGGGYDLAEENKSFPEKEQRAELNKNVSIKL